MQTYINENRPSFTILKTIRPNVEKVFLRNVLYISGIAAGIIAILIYLDNMVGLDVFKIVFDTLGIKVDPGNLLISTILLFLSLAIVFLVVSYLSIINTRYEFYEDRVKMYLPVALIVVVPKNVSYKNVVKISYNYEGVINKLFKCGDVVIDLTGNNGESLKLEFIDMPENVVAQIMDIIRQYNSLQQMQFEENLRIGNIMKKF